MRFYSFIETDPQPSFCKQKAPAKKPMPFTASVILKLRGQEVNFQQYHYTTF